MTDMQHTRGNAPPGYSEGHHHGANELEEYAGGYIEAWVGYIPRWLLAVYAILFVWALYYGYTYWGGLGPGRPLW